MLDRWGRSRTFSWAARRSYGVSYVVFRSFIRSRGPIAGCFQSLCVWDARVAIRIAGFTAVTPFMEEPYIRDFISMFSTKAKISALGAWRPRLPAEPHSA